MIPAAYSSRYQVSRRSVEVVVRFLRLQSNGRLEKWRLLSLVVPHERETISMEQKDLLAAEVLKVDRVECNPAVGQGGSFMVAAGSNSDSGSDSTKG